MNLYCPECKKHCNHEINAWQTIPGKKDSVSILCEICSRLTIAVLSEISPLTLQDG